MQSAAGCETGAARVSGVPVNFGMNEYDVVCQLSFASAGILTDYNDSRLRRILNHPNVCALFDVGEDFIVMELVEGETLEARLKRGPLALADVEQVRCTDRGCLGGSAYQGDHAPGFETKQCNGHSQQR